VTSLAGRVSAPQGTAQDGQLAGPVRKPRDPYLDNIKAVLICLVAIGHTIGQFILAVPGATTVYTWVYLFHMPAFVLLCGVLTTSPDIDGRRVASMVRTLVVPCAVFQVLYLAYFEHVGTQNIAWTVDRLLTPVYHLWFLASLFVWRVAAPFLTRLRGAVPIAVLVSLAAGLSTSLGEPLSLDRTAALLPVFVIGLVLGRRALHLPTSPIARVTAVAVLLGSFPAAAAFHDHFGRGWLFWRSTYQQLGYGIVEGSLIRLLMLVWALLLTAAVFVLVPRRRTVLTACGEHSMYPYLLHAFLVQAFGWSHLDVTTPAQAVLAVVAAVAGTAVLASPPVRRFSRFLVEPRSTWLLKEPARATEPRSARAWRRGPWPEGRHGTDVTPVTVTASVGRVDGRSSRLAGITSRRIDV